MSELRSALDALLVVDDAELSDDQLVADLDEVEYATRQLQAVRARRLAELERREAWSRDGHLSLASWLGSRHQVAPSTAAGHVRMARALEAMPVAADAFSAGDLSPSSIAMLASARDAAPEQFGRDEASLVEAARTLPVEELKDTVTLWRHDHADDADDDRQELFLTPTLVGRGRLAGDLNTETTQVLITALRAVQDAEVRSNDRTDTRGRPPAGGPTPWERSADSGSTLRTGRWWPGSVRTSS